MTWHNKTFRLQPRVTVLALIATLLPSPHSYAATQNKPEANVNKPVPLDQTSPLERSATLGLPAVQSSEVLPSDSNSTFRLSFAFGTPRRYASRYLAASRILQLRVTPARSEEFQPAEYYDGRFVHRVIIKESNGEVFIDLQLKNQPTDWVVTHQESPWRIIVDLWRKPDSNSNSKSKNPDWQWSGFFASSNSDQTTASQNSEKPIISAMEIPGLDGATTESPITEPINASERAPKASGPAPADALGGDSLPNLAGPSAQSEQTDQAKGPLKRFLVIESGPVRPEDSAPAVNAARAEELFLRGEHDAALNSYRRLAGLSQREFVTDPNSLWYAAESAIQVNKNDAARDYLLTLKKSNPSSIYSHYATLRLLDLDLTESSEAPQKKSDSFAPSYLELAQQPGAPWIVKAIAALRFTELKPTGTSAEQSASLLPSFQNCVREARLVRSVKRDCAFQVFKYDLKTDDLVAAQKTIKEYEAAWPGDSRVAAEKSALEKRISSFIESLQTAESYLAWNKVERNSAPEWLAFTNKSAELLRRRAAGWERSDKPQQALGLYERAADSQSEPKAKMALLAKAANLAQKSNNTARANQSLAKIQAIPERNTTGLAAEDYALIREIALPPSNNKSALKLVLDDLFKGFHAENDIRTIVSLTEQLDGSREADFLFEKILAVPSRSAAEAELKADALLNYAETLRNQGRLVKSADTFLAVANLDNGKNRAEAAYKAGVVYFRAGLLEKATTSWNIAANDLENSKYSALATERLNRIR